MSGLWWSTSTMDFTSGFPAQPRFSSVVGQQPQRIQTSGKCWERLVRMASQHEAEDTNSVTTPASSLFAKERERSDDGDEPRDFFSLHQGLWMESAVPCLPACRLCSGHGKTFRA